MTSTSLIPVLQTAMNGEQTRGSHGVVFQNKAQGILHYITVDEIPSEELRDRVSDILSEEGDTNYFVVEEVERVMHIWKIPKAQAIQQMMHDIDADSELQVRQIEG